MTGLTRLNFIRTPLFYHYLLYFIFFQFLNWHLLTVNLSWKSSPCFDTWLNLTPLSLLALKPQQLGQILHQGCQYPFQLKTEDLLSSKSISSCTGTTCFPCKELGLSQILQLSPQGSGWRNLRAQNHGADCSMQSLQTYVAVHKKCTFSFSTFTCLTPFHIVCHSAYHSFWAVMLLWLSDLPC